MINNENKVYGKWKNEISEPIQSLKKCVSCKDGWISRFEWKRNGYFDYPCSLFS